MSKANGQVEVGDTVRLRWPSGMKKIQTDTTHTVVGRPGNQVMDATWWTFTGDQSGNLLIVTELIAFEVLN